MTFDMSVLTDMWDLYCIPAALFTVAVALLIVLYFRNRRSDLPPGPRGLPIVGYLPFLGRQPHLTLSRLAEKYGEVMSLNVCGKTVIHLNGFESIRDAYSNQGEEFSGRPQDFSFAHWLMDWQGIAQSEGPVWKEHRRFVLHTLRDFGFGELSLEARVQQTVGAVLRELKDTGGVPYDPYQLLSYGACNVICHLLLDHPYAFDDAEFVELHSYLRKASVLLPGPEEILALPFTRYFRRFSRRCKELREVKEGFQALMKKHIEHHQDTFDSSNLRDYVDVYLEERRRAEEEKTLDKSSFTLPRLTSIVFSLFLEGTETTARTLQWALKILMDHRDVQDNIQKELDEVVGRGRFPSWADRANLPYTEAVVSEVLRYSSLVTTAPFHSTLDETTLRGYTIPKRSTVIANLWSAHRNPKYWPDPETFDPSRFLDPDGKVSKRDGLIPFSIGKRVCPGDSLSRMEIFLFLTSILQRFHIRPPEGEENQATKCSGSVLRCLEPYRLCVVPR